MFTYRIRNTLMIKLLNKCAIYQKWIFSSIKQPETFIKKPNQLIYPRYFKVLKKSQNSKKKAKKLCNTNTAAHQRRSRLRADDKRNIKSRFAGRLKVESAKRPNLTAASSRRSTAIWLPWWRLITCGRSKFGAIFRCCLTLQDCKKLSSISQWQPVQIRL